MSRAWHACAIPRAAAILFLQSVRVMEKRRCQGVVLFGVKGVCAEGDGSAASLFLTGSCVKREFNRERGFQLVSRDLKKG